MAEDEEQWHRIAYFPPREEGPDGTEGRAVEGHREKIYPEIGNPFGQKVCREQIGDRLPQEGDDQKADAQGEPEHLPDRWPDLSELFPPVVVPDEDAYDEDEVQESGLQYLVPHDGSDVRIERHW